MTPKEKPNDLRNTKNTRLITTMTVSTDTHCMYVYL